MKKKLGVLAIAILTLAFFWTGYAYGAIEISVPVMKMSDISVDLGPDYVFKEPSAQGNDSNPSGLGVEIDNIKDPEVKNAILIVSPKDKSMDTIFLGSMFRSILELGGAEETNNMTLTGSNGQNVTLHAFNTTESMSTKCEEMFFALWDMDPMNTCSLISTLDEETTKKIVETLAIKA